MDRILLVSLRSRGTICPSQWDGETAEGQKFYARYRHGTLRIDVDDEVFWSISEGPAWSGMMSTREMLDVSPVDLGPGIKLDEEWMEAE